MAPRIHPAHDGALLEPGGLPDAEYGFGESPGERCGPECGDGGAEALVRPAEAELYEGAVRLKVGIEGRTWLVVHFMTELRQNPQMRLLRMLSTPPSQLEIWLGLQEPIPLADILGKMEEVSSVTVAPMNEAGSPDSKPVFNVRLNWEFCHDRGPGMA
jgi:hypothetical protein